MRALAKLAVCGMMACCGLAVAEPPVHYTVVGEEIPVPLTTEPAVGARGRSVMAGRDANCLLCHSLADADARFTGNLAPALDGVGARLAAGQLRLRIVDSSRLNRETIMPSYYRTEGLERVAQAWRDRPILTAQQVEDVVAYMLTLR
jgi:sulfur-oxidizing protein SoxX